MNWVNPILILLAAFVFVFLETAFQGLRHLLGAQIDLLPALVVYASLNYGVGMTALVAVLGGLWFDSLSVNSLGVSILPYFLTGFLISTQRGLILRDQTFAQIVLGLCASAAAPALTLLLLLSMHQNPLFGWGTLWQWIVMTAGGGILTPVFFRLFDRLQHAMTYQPVIETSFRPDREIRRGRK
ncbi:MAG TPA: rod shape-determining protein MreD [Verrucomicrobiae bacterium]|nr:rod shape-determining protein MreD [Verrucomicrobiae bacterium]